MDHRKEIDRLYTLEYGDRVEFVLRMLLATVGALIHRNYTGEPTALLWLAGFIATHLILFSVLVTRPANSTARDTYAAGIMTLIMLGAFLWLPASLIAEEDIALRISGTAGTGTLLVFLIYRCDRMKWMVLGEVAVVALAVGYIIMEQAPNVTDRGAQLVMGFAALTLVAYFARTMLDHRRQRIEAEEAAVRSVQAQKMEAVGQLAGGVAHDFNNILTAITGNLDLYEAIDDPEEKDQFVRDAQQATERAAALVRQLLAYSRKSTLAVAEHSVALVFDQVATFSRRLLPSSIQLVFQDPCDIMRVRVDQTQLITAMINLIVNARDALAGSGKLEVRATGCDLTEATPMLDGATIAPGRYVCITIQDNGPGIPKDVLRRVTEPFFTTKEVGEGSGLGLSMVEGFARQSGGGMMIETSDAGTRVRLYLPCASLQPVAEPLYDLQSTPAPLARPAVG